MKDFFRRGCSRFLIACGIILLVVLVLNTGKLPDTTRPAKELTPCEHAIQRLKAQDKISMPPDKWCRFAAVEDWSRLMESVIEEYSDPDTGKITNWHTSLQKALLGNRLEYNYDRFDTVMKDYEDWKSAYKVSRLEIKPESSLSVIKYLLVILAIAEFVTSLLELAPRSWYKYHIAQLLLLLIVPFAPIVTYYLGKAGGGPMPIPETDLSIVAEMFQRGFFLSIFIAILAVITGAVLSLLALARVEGLSGWFVYNVIFSAATAASIYLGTSVFYVVLGIRRYCTR